MTDTLLRPRQVGPKLLLRLLERRRGKFDALRYVKLALLLDEGVAVLSAWARTGTVDLTWAEWMSARAWRIYLSFPGPYTTEPKGPLALIYQDVDYLDAYFDVVLVSSVAHAAVVANTPYLSEHDRELMTGVAKDCTMRAIADVTQGSREQTWLLETLVNIGISEVVW